MFSTSFSDRFRTATNVFGDCYTVAVVEKLSRRELKNEVHIYYANTVSYFVRTRLISPLI